MKFFNNILDSMEARRRREDRMALMIFGGGCLTFIVLGIIIAIITGILNAVETANVKSAYGEIYASACQPVPEGSDSTTNIPDATTPRRVLLLTGDTQRRHAWHSDLPAQWKAENEDQVAIIGCVTEEEILLETCEYQRDSARSEEAYTVRLERQQYQATIVLINSTTSRRIDTLTVTGTEPEPCPDDDGRLTSGELSGGAVSWSDFASRVESYIFGG